jgi:hypothetical protein
VKLTLANASKTDTWAYRKKCPSTHVWIGRQNGGGKPRIWRTKLLKLTIRKKTVALTAIVGVALALAACQDAGDKEMTKPVNCGTAKQDVATLEKEKASVLREMGAGVQTFLPIGAVVGLFRGKYDKNSRIAGGQYNKDIDAHIAEIKRSCRV